MKKIKLINLSILLLLFIFKPIKVFGIEINKPAKFGVLFFQENNAYNTALKDELTKIQENNKDKVEFTFYDGKFNQETQNSQLEEAINNKLDVLLLNIVDINSSKYIIDKVKENNIPIIFFDVEPSSFDYLKSYGKALYIGADNCNLGIAQGKMIMNQYKNKSIVDRNNNNMLDYVLLKGNINDIDSIYRSKCVIDEINNSGLKTRELYSGYFNWSKETTKEVIKPVLLQVLDNVDVIISNNDDMAIGAIESLQDYGYNSVHNNRYIPVVGINALDEAKKLIENGFMEGTLEQSPKVMAEALYEVGLNMSEHKNPLQDTNYTFDSSGIAIRIPPIEIITKK